MPSVAARPWGSSGRAQRAQAPHRRDLLAVAGALSAMLVGLTTAGAASSPAQQSAFFWDQYLACRRLLSEQADSSLALARSLLSNDSGHFLGAWLLAASLVALEGTGDNARGSEPEPEQPGDRGTTAGLAVQEGTRLILEGRLTEGLAALERARDAYERLGRAADASRAVLWKVVLPETGSRSPTAASDLQNAELLARRSRDAAAIADVLLLQSEIEGREDAPMALRLLREAAALLEPLGPGAQLMRCHRALAIALKRAGEIDAAEPHYQATLDLARALGDRVQESRAIAGLAQVQKGRGAIEAALALQMRALEVARDAGSAEDIASRTSEIGALYTQLGHFRQAREQLEAALSIMEGAQLGAEDLAFTLDALASVEALTGQLEPARQHWERALALCQEAGARSRTPFLLLHLAQLNLDLGDPGKASELAATGLATAREVGHRRAELPLLALAAAAAIEGGEPAVALDITREASRLARQVEPRYLWEISRIGAAALHGLGRTADAVALLDSTIALFPTIPDSMRLGLALRLQGSLYRALGQSQAAMSRLERSRAIARAHGDRNHEAAVCLELGLTQLALGRSREAIALLEEGLAWVDETRAGIASSEERRDYQARWYDSYVALAQAYSRAGRAAEAFATLERTRAREMRELFGARTPGLRGKVSPDLAQSMEAVEGDLTETQIRIVRASGPGDPALPHLEARADSLKAVWVELSHRVQREAPRYARVAGVQPPVTAAEVQAMLDPDEQLIAFMVGAEGALRFDLSHRGLYVHEIHWPESVLQSAVTRLEELVRAGENAKWPEQAAILADTLLGVATPTANPPARLYVLPDGPLHRLPFEMLPVADGAGTRTLLLETAEVVYANSATLLLADQEAERCRQREVIYPLLAFGDPAAGPPVAGPPAEEPAGSAPRGGRPAVGPLPYAREEVLRLIDFFPEARVHIGEQATEQRFFDETPQAEILHVAAHAFVDDCHPAFSGITLAPTAAAAAGGTASDGLVQAHEVLESDLCLELAVLSACETGVGALRRGEGLVGLSRAFRLAGARNLVVSLWKVDDRATAEFMAEFYARLSHGATAPAALRGAKLAFLRDAPGPENGAAGQSSSGLRGVGRRTQAQSHAAPAAWAPFILIGTRVP
jgi:CHAT domain-containing protein/tetratricopeptide (TPR) repeat protein